MSLLSKFRNCNTKFWVFLKGGRQTKSDYAKATAPELGPSHALLTAAVNKAQIDLQNQWFDFISIF